jgi:hypothetical protein
MTNFPQILSGDGKIKTELRELRAKANMIQPQYVRDMLVSTTTRGAFSTPKRRVRQVSQSSGGGGARWL